jgi:hypothetical protein
MDQLYFVVWVNYFRYTARLLEFDIVVHAGVSPEFVAADGVGLKLDSMSICSDPDAWIVPGSTSTIRLVSQHSGLTSSVAR